MAFGRNLVSGIGTTPTVVSNTVPPVTTHTVHGLSISNTSLANANVTVTATDGATTISIVKSIMIPPGDILGVMGMEFKHNLIPCDSISVTSSTAASLDVMFSYLEQ